MTLVDLNLNEKAKIRSLPQNEQLAAQLLEQGFIPNTEITLVHKALWRGPLAFRLHNTKIVLQPSLAKQVMVDIV